MARRKLDTLALILEIAASIVAVIGFFQRITCPCDGQSLPLFGDNSLLGTRYCGKCGHNH